MGYPRVGHINFLNCLPLTYSFQHGGYTKGLQIEAAVPAVLNNDVVNHRLDVSPVSSIVYARASEELKILPDVCISAEKQVQSLIIVSRKPLEQIGDDKVILTAKSATTHCLVKIILRKAYGAQPNYYIRHINTVNPVPADATAALLIGDDALYVYHHREPDLYYYDVQEEWRKLTGKWMVFAVWVANRQFAAEHHDLLQLVYDRITKGFAYGYARKADAIRSVLMEKPFKFEELDEYLEVIRWKLGEDQLDGLRTFYALAHEMNLIDHIPEIELADVCR